MFRDVKVGDRVWSTIGGWGTVERIDNGGFYPVVAKHDAPFPVANELCSFTISGKAWAYGPQCLFWDEVKIVPPPRPKRKVKKVVEGWVNLFEDTDGRINLTNNISCNPIGPAGIVEVPSLKWRWLGQTKIRHEFEVEE